MDNLGTKACVHHLQSLSAGGTVVGGCRFIHSVPYGVDVVLADIVVVVQVVMWVEQKPHACCCQHFKLSEKNPAADKKVNNCGRFF